MTILELIQAKREKQTVIGPHGAGKVNGIGRKYTYIHYDGDNLQPARVIEAPNSTIKSV